MPFPNPSTQFRKGGPPGPGRPRKHPRKIRGTPWLELRRPDVDFDAQVELWASMVRNRQWAATSAMIALVDRCERAPGDAASARILAALTGRLRSLRTEPATPPATS